MTKFVDCQMCGALIIERLWPQHHQEHRTGERPILPVVQVLHINALARQLAPAYSPEDFQTELVSPDPNPKP